MIGLDDLPDGIYTPRFSEVGIDRRQRKKLFSKPPTLIVPDDQIEFYKKIYPRSKVYTVSDSHMIKGD